MSKNNKKKNYSFAESFLFGEKLAEMRVELARKYDNEDITGNEEDVREYILLKEQDGFKNVLAGSLGYIYGYYATFCPFQFQLDDFDNYN